MHKMPAVDVATPHACRRRPSCSGLASAVASAGGSGVQVKRLPKIKAPARFGRKLTESQKALATHICVDCGFIYFLKTPFEETDPDYRCPQCQAPKKRFSKYDPETGKTIGGTSQDLATLLTVTLGLAGVGVLAYLGFSL